MYVPFPNEPVYVPAQPDEDCRGRIVIGVVTALVVEAVVLIAAIAAYDLLDAWLS